MSVVLENGVLMDHKTGSSKLNKSESDVTCGQVWLPILGICALQLTHPKCTHTAVNTHTHREHTHTVNTHTPWTHTPWTHTHREHTHTPWTHTPWTHTRSSGQPYCCSARGAVGGSVSCSRVSPQSWYWGWSERWLFTPPTYNPCRTWDSNSQPFGYESDFLTIRPRLPPKNALQ